MEIASQARIMRTDSGIPQSLCKGLLRCARLVARFGNRADPAFLKSVFRPLQWALSLTLLTHLGAPRAADVIRGGELYRQHCAACHGAKGRPQMVGTPDFSQPATLLKPDMALLQAIRAGQGAMPAYQGLLRDRDLLDIVAHLRTLR